jgi:hypothetical protein
LVGQARLTVLWFDIYDAKLYTPDGQYKQNSNLKLSLTYLRDFDAKDLIEETFNQMKPKPNQEQQKTWQASLELIWPDVTKSDNLSFVVNDESVGHFYFNNRHVGTIKDADFNKRFANIWLSDDSEYPKLAAKLTGKTK